MASRETLWVVCRDGSLGALSSFGPNQAEYRAGARISNMDGNDAMASALLTSFNNRGGICWRPEVKGLTIMVNSIFNGWRMEDVWLV